MTTRRKLSSGISGSATPPQGTLSGAAEPPRRPGSTAPAEEVPKTAADADKSPGLKAPGIPVGWGNIIVDSLKLKDPASLARRLRDELSLGEDRTAYGIVLEALDKSAKNVDDASRLYRAAKLEEESYERQVGERLEVMRTKALAELMAEYQAKRRPSPTAEAIRDRMVANWPDEFHTIEGRKAELHALTRSLENLMEAWKSRAADLRIMAGQVARPH